VLLFRNITTISDLLYCIQLFTLRVRSALRDVRVKGRGMIYVCAGLCRAVEGRRRLISLRIYM